jgi:hypothetical protein
MSTTYLEELDSGDCFTYNDLVYVVSKDFKSNGNRSCLSLVDGSSRWLEPNTMIDKTQIFTMDKDSNIIAIKESKKADVSNQSQNIS